MKFIHIAPKQLMEKVSEYNQGLDMILTHKVLEDEEYAKIASNLNSKKILDNSFFELHYSLPPNDMIEAAHKIGATWLICPDGTTDGLQEFKNNGFKVMCVPTSKAQFHEFMSNSDIDLVALSEEHLTYRHDVSARFYLLQEVGDYYLNKGVKDKIHFLGMGESAWEVGMCMPWKNLIHSWDSSSAIWHGLHDIDISKMHGKMSKAVDFDFECTDITELVKRNVTFISDMIHKY